MKIADRVAQLKPSATLAVNARAQELKAQGKDILSLSVGEPDFPTPKHIREAGKKAIDDGFTRYTAVPGIPQAREAVAGYFKHFYGVNASGENVLISNGGKQCLYNIFQTLLNPGDHVLIPSPYWVSYPPMVELAGAKPVIIPATPEASFKVTISQLQNSLTPKTRLLILNSPSNPTGACYSASELSAIAAWAVEKDIIVVSDEIYDRLTYTKEGPQSLSPWWEKYQDNFIIVNGVAKAFCMTGWRIGYTLASSALTAAMARLQGQTTSNACSIAQMATLAALDGNYGHLDPMREAFVRRRDMAMEIISTWPDVVCPVPDGAFYLFPDVHNLYGKEFTGSASMCTTLLDKAGVALVPGAAFGNDNCIRISYAVSDDVLADALKRVTKVLVG